MNTGRPEDLGFSLVFFLQIFVSILLHELGHVFAARTFGIRTRDVTLNFFGGVARLERGPKTLFAQGVIAFAGPATNLALAALCGGLPSILPDDAPNVHAMAYSLAIANLFLAAFNLLPGHPFDGGTLARSLLSTKLSRAKARLIVGRSGQVISIALGLLGLALSPLSIPIAAFLFLAARNDVRAAKKALDRAGPRFASTPNPATTFAADEKDRLSPPRAHQGLRARLGLPRRTRM
jgi:Zn-dependent protease